MTTKTSIPSALCALAAATALCGCQPEKPTLHLYTWANYMSDEVVAQFEADHHCHVAIDTFDTNEAMYARLMTSTTDYDLVFPSSYMAKLMEEDGMLLPLDHALLPNLKHVDPKFLAMSFDQDMRVSVPYSVTITGIGYLAELGNPEPTWALFERADLKNRISILDDYRETIGAALKFLGYSVNSTDDAQLAEAKEVVKRWKKNAAIFDNEQYNDGLAKGKYALTHGYSGDIKLAQGKNPDVRFLVPREGACLSCDDMVIPKSAPHPELAHAFINTILDPATSAQLMQDIWYLCPNVPAYDLLPEEFHQDPIFFPPADIVTKLEMIDEIGADNAKYVKLWAEIKAED
ncbi:MAG: spermidine/putrescine ABC transporter substrate-binding protein [Kiritimatiellae bacterium]|nr:spermidine/putrescine ABC transporter substrate-binding protein [Kiritimatiellia bacterium]